MLHSRVLAIVALFLVLGSALPVFCVPMSPMGTRAQDAAPMPCGGCHGHHRQAPAPTHDCCATHVPAAALQAAASVTPLNLVAHRQANERPGTSDRVLAACVDRTEFSPPPTAVLRI